MDRNVELYELKSVIPFKLIEMFKYIINYV